MGLRDIWNKIKGMFNRNKALPEGKIGEQNSEETVLDEVKDEIDEILEEIATPHQVFVENLQEQAKQVDLTKLPTEDIIIKLLEEKGLNTKLSENPEFKNQMHDIFHNIIDYVEGSIESRIKKLQSTISSGITEKCNFAITADGNFEYDTKTMPEAYREHNYSQHKYFSIDEQNNMNIITTDYIEEFNRDDGKLEIIERHSKKQETFDENGLQTEEKYAQYEKSNERPFISGKSYKMGRYPELVTSYLTVYETMNCLAFNSKSDYDKRTPLILDRNYEKAFIEVMVPENCPQKLNLNAQVWKYEDVSKLQQKEREYYENLGSARNTTGTGTEFYENSMYEDYIPSAVTEDEKAFRQNLIKKRLESITKRDPLFKKIAEQKGLIEKENVSKDEEL